MSKYTKNWIVTHTAGTVCVTEIVSTQDLWAMSKSAKMLRAFGVYDNSSEFFFFCMRIFKNKKKPVSLTIYNAVAILQFFFRHQPRHILIFKMTYAILFFCTHTAPFGCALRMELYNFLLLLSSAAHARHYSTDALSFARNFLFHDTFIYHTEYILVYIHGKPHVCLLAFFSLHFTVYKM